jgi:hypothetical protein
MYYTKALSNSSVYKRGGTGVAPSRLRLSVQRILRFVRLLEHKLSGDLWHALRSIVHVVHDGRGLLKLEEILDVARDRTTLGARSRVALAEAVARANTDSGEIELRLGPYAAE